MNRKARSRIDPVEVYCRIKPIFGSECEKCIKVLDESNLILQVPECSASYRSGQLKQLVYSFSEIFDETTTQKQLFDQVGYSLAEDLIAGKNGLLFTYGVTGSGKTYTMTGNQNEPGLLQQYLDTIFNSISTQQACKYSLKPDKMNSFDVLSDDDAQIERQRMIGAQAKISSKIRFKAQNDAVKINDRHGNKLINISDNHVYSVFISCIEIYNNYIYDLLDEQSFDSAKRIDTRESKLLKEDSKNCMYIKDLQEIDVRSTQEALEYMHRAQRRRVVASTDLNAESSRSHSVFTIKLVQIPYDFSKNEYLSKSKNALCISQMSFVDLAGSERSKRTNNTGSRLKEAGNINSSLMALRNCMETLRENIMTGSHKVIPYRDSKLTLLFKNFFEGNGKIKMILCINPNALEFDETVNVLKFSDLVKDVLIPMASDARATKMSSEQETLSINKFLNCEKFSNFSLSSNFPPMNLFSSDDDVTVQKLIEFLEEFNRKRESILLEANSINQHLFMKLRELNEDYEKVKRENIELKHRLEIKEKNENKLEVKLKTLEKVMNSMRTQPSTVPKENQRVLSENDINKASSLLSFAEKKKQIESSTTTTATGAAPAPPVPPSIAPITATFRSSRITTATHTIGRMGCNNNNNSNMPPLPPSTPSAYKITTSTAINSQVQHQYNRFKSPALPTRVLVPPLSRDGAPVANRRAQRRSQSADNWLDHKPSSTVKTDTVLQPKMTRKKSVSKIELADAKKSSKYVLTHQQQDDEGELITSLIKGDIMKSPAGGASCIFTDVETLCVKAQETPKPTRKYRDSEELSNPDDRLMIEERIEIVKSAISKKLANSEDEDCFASFARMLANT